MTFVVTTFVFGNGCSLLNEPISTDDNASEQLDGEPDIIVDSLSTEFSALNGEDYIFGFNFVLKNIGESSTGYLQITCSSSCGMAPDPIYSLEPNEISSSVSATGTASQSKVSGGRVNLTIKITETDSGRYWSEPISVEVWK
jgi:hypothetical protein